MIRGFTGMLSRIFDRFGLPEVAKPRSFAGACCKYQRRRVRFVIAPVIFLCCQASHSFAAENLECPEIAPGRIPDLIGDATGSGLVTTENRGELVNEINYLINKLQINDLIFHRPVSKTC
jgi:hypothetical protein